MLYNKFINEQKVANFKSLTESNVDEFVDIVFENIMHNADIVDAMLPIFEAGPTPAQEEAIKRMRLQLEQWGSRCKKGEQQACAYQSTIKDKLEKFKSMLKLA